MTKNLLIQSCTWLFLLSFSMVSYGQERKFDVALGGGTAESFHVAGHYQIYPSGRIGASVGLVRSFNRWLLRPFYGIREMQVTTFSLEHSYFFKTKSKKVTPFYFRQGITYQQEEFLDFYSKYQYLYASLALGIALDFKNHLGASFDAGIAPIFWGLHNGHNMYFDDDVSEPYPFIAPSVRLQIHYWR